MGPPTPSTPATTTAAGGTTPGMTGTTPTGRKLRTTMTLCTGMTGPTTASGTRMCWMNGTATPPTPLSLATLTAAGGPTPGMTGTTPTGRPSRTTLTTSGQRLLDRDGR